jgi:hypothetical protein
MSWKSSTTPSFARQFASRLRRGELHLRARLANPPGNAMLMVHGRANAEYE